MRLKAALLTTLLLLAATADAQTPGAQSRGASRPDLAAYFKEFPAGAFVLYDLKKNRYLRYNEARCRERFTPFSTFKIANSLVGLETGVIADAEFVIKWDAKKYPPHDEDTLPFSAWWQDQTLRTAIKRSVVWYYRELALRVGRQRMKEYVHRLRYGNEDVSGPLDGFWLASSLKISPDEQVEFLKRLYREDLPVSKRSMHIVKDIITLEDAPGYRLSGKTGGGRSARGASSAGSSATSRRTTTPTSSPRRSKAPLTPLSATSASPSPIASSPTWATSRNEFTGMDRMSRIRDSEFEV
jgi:beta-lactamase class D